MAWALSSFCLSVEETPKQKPFHFVSGLGLVANFIRLLRNQNNRVLREIRVILDPISCLINLLRFVSQFRESKPVLSHKPCGGPTRTVDL